MLSQAKWCRVRVPLGRRPRALRSGGGSVGRGVSPGSGGHRNVTELSASTARSNDRRPHSRSRGASPPIQWPSAATSSNSASQASKSSALERRIARSRCTLEVFLSHPGDGHWIKRSLRRRRTTARTGRTSARRRFRAKGSRAPPRYHPRSCGVDSTAGSRGRPLRREWSGPGVEDVDALEPFEVLHVSGDDCHPADERGRSDECITERRRIRDVQRSGAPGNRLVHW